MWSDVKRVCVRPGVPDPAGLLVRALVLAIFYGAVHVAGWRQYTSFLCGTVEMAGGTVSWTAYAGAAYLVAYLGAVVLAPILLIAAGLLWLWDLWQARVAAVMRRPEWWVFMGSLAVAMAVAFCVVWKELHYIPVLLTLPLLLLYDVLIAFMLCYTVRLCVRTLKTNTDRRLGRIAAACVGCAALIGGPILVDDKFAGLMLLVPPLLVLLFPYGLLALFTSITYESAASYAWLMGVWALYILLIVQGIRWKSQRMLLFLVLLWLANASGCGRVMHWSTGSWG